MPAYTLTVLPGRYAVCKMPPTSHFPAWASGGEFVSLTRTPDELSIICLEAVLPQNFSAKAVERDWVLLRVEGPFSFNVTGVLAALTTTLADAGVALLAVATYDTDYLLLKAAQLADARAALVAAGHRVIA